MRKKTQTALRSTRSRPHKRTLQLGNARRQLRGETSHRKQLQLEILEIIDQERRRVGRELHDGLCQHLTAIAFMARAIAERFRSAKHVDPGELDKICDLINAGITEARTIARGLHPVEVDARSLMSALRTLVQEQSWTAPCRLEVKREPCVSDDTAALHLYRIAREALINASKHARASEIVLRTDCTRQHVILSVTDDGIGLKKRGQNSTGMGFHILRHRASSIGARLEIKAKRPHGTSVICYLPRK
jgi:signal transduction histidine kinase